MELEPSDAEIIEKAKREWVSKPIGQYANWKACKDAGKSDAYCGYLYHHASPHAKEKAYGLSPTQMQEVATPTTYADEITPGVHAISGGQPSAPHIDVPYSQPGASADYPGDVPHVGIPVMPHQEDKPPSDWLDRCVESVAATGSADEPYAVCTAQWQKKSKTEKLEIMKEIQMNETKKAILRIGKALAKAGYAEAGPEDPTPAFPSARAPPAPPQTQQTAQPQQAVPSPQEEPAPTVGAQAHSDPALSQPGAGAQATAGTEASGMGGMDSGMSSAVGSGSATMGAGSATSPQEAAAQMQPPQMVVADPAEHYPGIVQGLDTARKYLIEVSQRYLALGEQQKAQAIDKLVNTITQEHGNASTQQSVQQARTSQAGAGKAELPKPVASPVLGQGM